MWERWCGGWGTSRGLEDGFSGLALLELLHFLQAMYEIGIIDPHKVTRSALENAVSAASILLSVGCCMIEEKDS